MKRKLLGILLAISLLPASTASAFNGSMGRMSAAQRKEGFLLQEESSAGTRSGAEEENANILLGAGQNNEGAQTGGEVWNTESGGEDAETQPGGESREAQSGEGTSGAETEGEASKTQPGGESMEAQSGEGTSGAGTEGEASKTQPGGESWEAQSGEGSSGAGTGETPNTRPGEENAGAQSSENDLTRPEGEASVLPPGTEEETAQPGGSSLGGMIGGEGSGAVTGGEDLSGTGNGEVPELPAEDNGAALSSAEDGDGYKEENPDFPFTVFDGELADRLTGEEAEDQELVKDIQEGRILAIAPVFAEEMEELPQDSLLRAGSEAAPAALQNGQYVVYGEDGIFCDEIWTPEAVRQGKCMATTYRYVAYVDSGGKERKSPLYCMNARKMGLDTGSGGITLKEAAYRFLSNSVLKKILYFGYGGPGNICGDYDPTCSHIDWSKWENRYFFTHMALSIEYASDYNGATVDQARHVGILAFIEKLKSLTIPSRSAVKLRTTDVDGNAVITNALNMHLILYTQKPKTGFDWLESRFDDGFQRTSTIRVMDEGGAGNGITITVPEDAPYQLYYWRSPEEFHSRTMADPRLVSRGKTVTFKDQYVFGMIFPKSQKTSLKYTYTMSLYPVQYLFLDGNAQTGNSGGEIQDFSAYVYSGSPGKVSMTILPAERGTIHLTKTSVLNHKGVPGAEYAVYAAEDLKSGAAVQYKKGQKVVEGTTNQNGGITFSDLIPGKYEVRETKTAAGFLLEASGHTASVTSGKVTELKIPEVPDIRGTIRIEKLVEGTSLHLDNAEFTVYAWSEKTKSYSADASKLTYDPALQRYVSKELVFTADNLGKFRVKETRNPPGFTGSWAQDLQLEEPGTEKTFDYQVENPPMTKKRVEIRKVDRTSRTFLEGAEFTLYEYSAALGDYLQEGTLLTYDPDMEIYISGELKITDENLGRFLVRETKNPEGFTGSWEQEIDITKEEEQLQYTVENEPVKQLSGTAEIVKKDSLTGELLEGAEFAVYQWNQATQTYEDTLGPARLLAYDGGSGRYRTENLPLTDSNQGKFKLIETRNPDGYTGTWEQEIRLTEEKLSVSCEAENDPQRLPAGNITVTKKIPEKDIVWAHGNPVFSFVVEGTDQRGGYRKYENYIRFSQGGYETDGQGYASASITFQNIPLGTYEITEKPVFRYYLKAVQANSANVTITSASPPGPGKLPREVAWGTAVLSLTEKNASLTFINVNGRYDGYSHTDVIKNSIPFLKNSAPE